MAIGIHVDSSNRVIGYVRSSTYTAQNIPQNYTYSASFTVDDLYKIYDSANDTFTADDQTDSLKNPPVAEDPEE